MQSKSIERFIGKHSPCHNVLVVTQHTKKLMEIFSKKLNRQVWNLDTKKKNKMYGWVLRNLTV